MDETVGGGSLVTVRSPREVMTRQRLPYFLGISEATAGSRGLSLHLVVVPPGAAAEPHLHRDFETALYVLEGEVETRYGPGLRERVVNGPGDFLYIPPGVPHQPVNLSATARAVAVIARNNAAEQEDVIPYDPASATAETTQETPMATEPSEVRVPDMMCGNCEKAIRDALGKVEGVEQVDVDLAAKTVRVKGADRESVKAAIAAAGYSPE